MESEDADSLLRGIVGGGGVTRPLGRGDVVADRFVVERLTGTGGMGTVYQATDRTSGEPVAVKILQGRGGDHERFTQEAQVLAELEHPAIVRYVASGDWDGKRFLAMEWLDGEDLCARLRRAPLTVGESFAVAVRIADALAVAHARGVVHRDVKPANVFLVGGSPAHAKVLDFGIARDLRVKRRTETGVMIGTVGYVAPEQARGQRDVSVRADVFALGCVLLECLTGRPAFEGDNAIAILSKILADDAPPLSERRGDLPSELASLVERMLAKDPQQRPRDGAAVRDALVAFGSLDGPPPGAVTAPVAAPPLVAARAMRFVTVVLAGPETTDTPSEHSASAIQVGERSGAACETLVDGSLLFVFAGTAVATDRAANAARLALSLRHACPSRSIVIATGRAVAGSSMSTLPATGARMPVGEALDRAAALLAGAPGGADVKIDALTAGLLGPHFETTITSTSESVLVAERIEIGGPRLLLGKPTPCVGRDKELGLLASTLEECVTDRIARAVLVTAPPGVGKTRLASEFLARVRSRDDLRVLLARAEAVAAGSSLALARKLVRQAANIRDDEPVTRQHERLHSHLAGLMDRETAARCEEFIAEIAGVPTELAPSPMLRAAHNEPGIMREQQRRAFDAWIAAECERGPLVIVLEDLHWGDLPTVTYLDEAMKSLARRPLMVLALGRPEVHEAFPKLWAAAELEEIRLRGLTPVAAERLIHAVLGDRVEASIVERIVKQAEGNAFYLEELIRRVAEGETELPETILAMVQSRLERLELVARDVLRAASVFGERFWGGGVAALVDASSEPARLLETLVDRELLVRSHESRFAREREYVFRHALLRDASYAMLTDDDRRRAHLAAGTWLEGVDEKDGLVLADHFERGGAPERAIPWLVRAAKASLVGGNLHEVVRLGERGIACGAEQDRRGEMCILQATALGWLGGWSDAVARAREGMTLVPRGSTDWFVAGGTVFMGGSALGDMAIVQETLQEMAAVEADPTGPYAMAAAQVVFGLVYMDRAELVPHFIERLAASASRGPEPDPVFVAWRNIAISFLDVYVSRQLEAALHRNLEAVRVFEAAGDSLGRCCGHVCVSWAAIECGQFALAREAGAAATDIAIACEIPWMVEWGRFFTARAAVTAGTGMHAGDGTAIARIADPLMRALRRSALAQGYFASGDLESAAREAAVVAGEAEMMPIPLAMALGVLARVANLRDRPREALEHADRVCASDRRGAAMPLDGSIAHLVRSEALRAIGDDAGARVALVDARDRVQRFASAFADPAERALYLQMEPHVRTLALARDWLG